MASGRGFGFSFESQNTLQIQVPLPDPTIKSLQNPSRPAMEYGLGEDELCCNVSAFRFLQVPGLG